MQIYALDEKRNTISAAMATRQTCYFCPECRSPLKLRGGEYRQLHFYHLSFHPSCRQSGKTLFHLNTQFYIQNQLVPEETFLEKPFPEINRIADVVWPSKKIIFEVQCSPITPEEIKTRNSDYEKIGYQVVWILHDRRFNRHRQSSAENALLYSPHYYSNINASGEGFIYDQIHLEYSGKRKIKSKRLPIQLKYLSLPKKPKQFPSQLSRLVKIRVSRWRLSFEGDLLDGQTLANHIFIGKNSKAKKNSWNPILFFRAIYHLLLEMACE